jgi:hypothetical protein
MTSNILKIFSYIPLGLAFIIMLYKTYLKYVNPLDKGYVLDFLILGFVSLIISLILKNYERK